MKMKKVLCLMLILVFALGVGCAPRSEPAQADLSLQNMLPSNAGFFWIYWGFAEYGHELTLDEILREEGQIRYRLSGVVYDMSGGEAGGDYGISLEYVVSDGELSVSMTSERAMDNDFADMILLKLPLEIGTRWVQDVRDRNGNIVRLSSEIIQVEDGPPRTVTVRYQDENSAFFQQRTFEEGRGLIRFGKLFITEESEFDIGFDLFYGSEERSPF